MPNMPSSLPGLSTSYVGTDESATVDHADMHNDERGEINAIAALVGISGSAVVGSHDNLIKSAADPGHTHTGASLSSIPETDITDGSLLARLADAETVTGAWTFNAGKLLDKGSQVYDVKAYGAVGDGSTDDTTAIQAALDACATAGGGIVFFPEGTYISTLLTWKTGVMGVGAGPYVSIIKLKNTTNTNLITGLDFGTLTGGDTVAGIHHYGLMNIGLDGNKANNASGGYCFQAYGYAHNFVDVDVKQGKAGGIYLQGFTATDPISTYNRCGAMTRVNSHHNDGHGVYFNGPGDSTFTDCFFFYNDGTAPAGMSIGSRGVGLRIHGCHFYGNDQDYGIVIGAEGCSVIGCFIEGQQVAGIWVDNPANNARIEGNYFFAAGTQAAVVGVKIDDVSGYVITGNQFINHPDGSVLLTADNGGTVIGNYIYGTSGDAFPGTAAVTTSFRDNHIQGGVSGTPGTSATIATGIATIKSGVEYGYIAGEGAAADDLTNIVPVRAKGTVLRFLASHALTLKNAAGGTGPIITGTGGDLAVAQFGVFTVISDDPNWIVI